MPRSNVARAPLVACLGLLSALAGGCLTNLNQAKYFDKLEDAAPGLAARVHAHRPAIESSLREAITEASRGMSDAEVESIGLWGERWEPPVKVTDGEELYMKGRVFYVERPASPYYVAFRVAEDGQVQVDDVRVFGHYGGRR